MLNNLITSHGFVKAVQYSGYLILGLMLLACVLVHPRFVPSSLRTGPATTPSPVELFKSKPYTFLVLGIVFVSWGLFFPIFYIRKLTNLLISEPSSPSRSPCPRSESPVKHHKLPPRHSECSRRRWSDLSKLHSRLFGRSQPPHGHVYRSWYPRFLSIWRKYIRWISHCRSLIWFLFRWISIACGSNSHFHGYPSE